MSASAPAHPEYPGRLRPADARTAGRLAAKMFRSGRTLDAAIDAICIQFPYVGKSEGRRIAARSFLRRQSRQQNAATPGPIEVPTGQTIGRAQLYTLAQKIREAHDEAEAHVEQAHGAARRAVEAAIRCGELLGEAKEKVGHGGWGSWLDENFPASQQTAALYMRMADRRAEIEHAVSIRDARGLLSRVEARARELKAEQMVEKYNQEKRAERVGLNTRTRQAPAYFEAVKVYKKATSAFCEAVGDAEYAAKHGKRFARDQLPFIREQHAEIRGLLERLEAVIAELAA